MKEVINEVLIFNGLTDSRFELTKYLNLKKDKKVLLIESESEKYDDKFSLDLDIYKQKKRNLEIEKRAMQGCNIKLRRDYDGLYEMMDKACLSCAAVIFRNKVFSNKQDKYIISDLMKELHIKDEFKPFFNRLLFILEEQGYIINRNEEIMVLKSIDEIPEVEVVLNQFTPEQKKFLPYVELLVHCASKYEGVFRGAIPANEVIYPNGQFNMLDSVDKQLPLSSKRAMYGEVLAQIINDIAREKKKKVRILEIGAGTGELTYKILAHIKDIGDIDYCFTDIGQSFVARAKFDIEEKGCDFVSFAKLDISSDIEKQGFYENSFDIIISYDVIQATENIEASLNNIRKMLVPDGVSAQIQSYGDHHIDNLIYGLSPGWWNFTKDPLRGKRITILPCEWQKVLEIGGFTNIQILPEEIELSDSAVILSRKSDFSSVDKNILLYNNIKNNRLKKLKSINEQCNIEFIKSFDKTDIDNYINSRDLAETAEILFRDTPNDNGKDDNDTEMSASDLKLIKILKTIFGAENISINDQLLDIGLDSLSGLLLITKIREEFKTELTMKDFYSFKSVSDISEYLKNIDIEEIEANKEEDSEAENKSIDDLFDLL